MMSNYYTLLGIEPTADQSAIDAAYRDQQARYSPERVADMDAEMARIAQDRTAELEQAYRILSDPERRRRYDAELHGGSVAAGIERRNLTRREGVLAMAGILVAMVVIGIIWVVTTDDTSVDGQAMGEVNRPAPGFTLNTLDGGQIDLETYRGQIVLVNFWASWCEPCKRELPALQQAYETYADEGLMVIGINLTDDELLQGATTSELSRFIDQYGVTYPIGLDVEGQTTDDYRVFPLPTSFFIDADGQIRYAHIGELTLTDISVRFNELRQGRESLWINERSW
jgi:cytochrome c biogenesis protein CcmG/thiol:disulfide interchange protein DsbE